MTYYFIIGTTFLASVIVNAILKNKFRAYSKLYLHSHMSGKEIAEKMLIDHGISDVHILSVEGELTDHYNPINKTINLSEKVYNDRTAASIAIAAHECGHALQHRLGYHLLKLRNHLVPILNFSSKFVNLAIMSGLTIFYSSGGKDSFILKLGIGLFFLIVVFSFITLPIELDASNRALTWIRNKNIVNHQEYNKAKESLNWAAMTYVISAFGSLAQLVYFLSFITGKKDEHF
ncbi:Putative membrane protease yugP [Blattabacterium sp. (Nauphoeta cinerea)]|uniref:zinc metallopeptidase n=1 Tax=Blattabacterium sp. (Nauphoeta cinerea) TaxID=1316444 RepID=UPI0003B0D550|nr:zinc metallopeptidase [Blattabacterium sp. (Nauphoeta cinerea)]AGW85964.1 Putative membrane protease yugP [Blattabacterium sp. (Nauphoeta cinerea)]